MSEKYSTTIQRIRIFSRHLIVKKKKKKSQFEQQENWDNWVSVHTRCCDLFATPLRQVKHLKSWPSLESDTKSSGASASYTLIELRAGCCWFLVYLFSSNPISPPTHIPILMQTNPHECKHKATKSLNTLSFGIYTTSPIPPRSPSTGRRFLLLLLLHLLLIRRLLLLLRLTRGSGTSSFWGLFMFICWHNLVTLFALFVVVLRIKFTSIR